MFRPGQALRRRASEHRRRCGRRDRDRNCAQPVHTVTVALLALSAPRQLAVAGVTEYFHEPDGTPFSVHVSTAIVPEQFAPIVCRTPVLAL